MLDGQPAPSAISVLMMPICMCCSLQMHSGNWQQHNAHLCCRWQPAQCCRVSGFPCTGTAPDISHSCCPPQRQVHHKPPDRQASWHSPGVEHAGSLHTEVWGHLRCHLQQGQRLASSLFISWADGMLANKCWQHKCVNMPAFSAPPPFACAQGPQCLAAQICGFSTAQ